MCKLDQKFESEWKPDVLQSKMEERRDIQGYAWVLLSAIDDRVLQGGDLEEDAPPHVVKVTGGGYWQNWEPPKKGDTEDTQPTVISAAACAVLKAAKSKLLERPEASGLSSSGGAGGGQPAAEGYVLLIPFFF